MYDMSLSNVTWLIIINDLKNCIIKILIKLPALNHHEQSAVFGLTSLVLFNALKCN